jgi:hypothetical protein
MEFYLIRNVGAEVTGTAGATAKLDFTVGTNYAANFLRQAVLVASCGASPVYAKVVGRSSGITPTITSTNWHVQIPAGQTVLIRATREVDVYLNGSTAYTAQELG